MKKILTLLIILCLYQAVFPATRAHRFSFYINGPSITKHFDPYHREYNDFHPGIGGEFYFHNKKWIIGLNGHYMFKDSFDRKAYWIGLVNGISLGNYKRLWFEPFIIIGGLKKAEYNYGKFGFFAMPFLSVGYNRFGINIGYIPKLQNITFPILLVQIKIRVARF
jgi:hypothetical protein